MLLEQIANISSGLVLRRKEAVNEKEIIKNYKALTLKSFNEVGYIEEEHLDVFNSDEVLDQRYLTKKDDIVIRLTEPYTAISIKDEFVGLIVPSQFCVIKITNEDFNSNYLSYMLNSEYIKAEYIRNSLGTTIPVIRVGQLRETDIPYMNKNKQQIIGELQTLIVKDKQLREQLDLEIDSLNKQIELRIIGGLINE